VRLLVVVHLPGGVYSASEVLTISDAVPLTGATARCGLPGPFPGQLPAPSRPLTPPPTIGKVSDEWPPVDWGVVNSSSTVTIRAIGVEIEVDDLTTDLAVRFDRELNSWGSLLHTWLAILASGPPGVLFSTGAVTWPTEIEHELLTRRYRGGDMYEPERSSPWGWRHALSHAAAGDQPPASRALLAKATTSAFDEDYRPAVLDAATATEIALTQGISRHLGHRGADAEVKDLILRNRTLGGLIQLARELSLHLQSPVKTDLLELRNRVAHHGVAPDQDAAHKAIAAARGVVEYYDPLTDHCDEAAILAEKGRWT